MYLIIICTTAAIQIQGTMANWVVRTWVYCLWSLFSPSPPSFVPPFPLCAISTNSMGRGIHCQNLLNWAFQVRKQNTAKTCEKHETIDGLFVEIQPTVWGIRCQKLLDRAFRIGRREHSKGEKHNNNLYACSGTSQSNHPHSVFTSNTLDSSDINYMYLGFVLGIYLNCLVDHW